MSVSLSTIGVDVAVGIVSTVIGVIITYWIARPWIQLDPVIRSYSDTRGRTYFRVRARSLGFIRLTHVNVVVAVSVRGPHRTSGVPVPLSKAEWLGESRRAKTWSFTPRLLLDEVHWKRHLPSGIEPPPTPSDLPGALSAVGGRVFVTVIATSAVFAVSAVRKRYYDIDEIAPWVAPSNTREAGIDERVEQSDSAAG